MKTRSIKELLQVMLDNFNLFEEKSCNGLCMFRDFLFSKKIINYNEWLIIIEYMIKNKPKKTFSSNFWFKPHYQVSRKEWIINELKKYE